jgi:nicotinamidase-related amidase
MPTSKTSSSLVSGKSSTALLLIDVINDLDFPEGPQFLRQALPAARHIAALKRRAKRAGVPAIYVNDNFGRWQSDFLAQVKHAQHEKSRGRDIAKLLAPEEDDYFVLKPRHSGFFSTTLDILLNDLGTKTLILTGFAGDICVLYTANDAYMRDYEIIVASDGIASNTKQGSITALKQMKNNLRARVCTAARVPLGKTPQR